MVEVELHRVLIRGLHSACVRGLSVWGRELNHIAHSIRLVLVAERFEQAASHSLDQIGIMFAKSRRMLGSVGKHIKSLV